MKEYNDLLAEDDDLKAAYERAHELYLAFRHEIAVAMEDSEEHIEGTSAGGMLFASSVCTPCWRKRW